MEYITTKEASEKWGISTTRITILANQGRIPGAQRLGKSWLIPADADKPEKRRGGRAASVEVEEDDFSFPLYPCRPDWSRAKEAGLSPQRRRLRNAQNALVECRFAESLAMLEPILKAPEDLTTEIGCLWTVGICCVALNKPDDFSKAYFRLQMIFSGDFPHREDLIIILDELNTYMESIGEAANYDTFNTDIHEQSIPLLCLMIGYGQLIREVAKRGSADPIRLEILTRFLETTSAGTAVAMMHCYLLGIYFNRQDMEAVQKHAEAVVRIAYSYRIYFPLVTYYWYLPSAFESAMAQYPESFRAHCMGMISEYEKNFTAFFAAFNENSPVAKLKAEDYPYIYAVMQDLSNAAIGERMGISQPTVKRRMDRVCEKLGVGSKKELKEYLLNHL